MTDSPAPAPRYVVQGQAEVTDIGPTGAYVSGVRVTFRTASGSIGSVFIPGDQYNLDTVKSAVDARCATMEAVAALGGAG